MNKEKPEVLPTTITVNLPDSSGTLSFVHNPFFDSPSLIVDSQSNSGLSSYNTYFWDIEDGMFSEVKNLKQPEATDLIKDLEILEKKLRKK